MLNREFRAVWITTGYNLDWPSTSGLDSKRQQLEFIELINRAKSAGMNAAVVQVRVAGDAFYPSEIVPWSQWLTGTQGKAPSPWYDPLKFMIEECHKRNMEFHAWFNPFRSVSHYKFSSIAENHISKEKPLWHFKYGNSTYVDPGYPDARTYLAHVIKEVVQKYEVDGVHIDDYFYPYPKSGETINDYASWEKYGKGKGFRTRADWRRHNIDEFVQLVNLMIKTVDPRVKFGISPGGVWRNASHDPRGCPSKGMPAAYDDQYADTKKWLEKGWVDYLAPQLYWNTKHKYADYGGLLDWWSALKIERHLYIGHSIYMMDLASMSWLRTPEYINQVKMSRKKPTVKGNIYYRAQTLQTNPHGIYDSLRTSLNTEFALIPPMEWIDNVPPGDPHQFSTIPIGNGVFLTWSEPEAAADGELPAYYIVYRFPEKEEIDLNNSKRIIAIQKRTTITDKRVKPEDAFTYVVVAFDRLHNASLNFAKSLVKFP